MNNLELRYLYNYCDRYELDYQEIDDTLTYSENLKHLKELVRILRKSGDTFELARMKSLQEQYMTEHPLHYYLSCQIAGTARPRDIGKVIETRGLFSLKNHISK